MTPRRIARQTAFQFIYRFDSWDAGAPAPDELRHELMLHFQHFNTPEDVRDFTLRLVQGTLQNLPAVDDLAKRALENWRLERLGAVEKALLRMGIAELVYFKDVPSSVTLDEIIELAKHFGTEDAGSFLNGVLEPVSKWPETTTGKVASDPKE